MTHLGIETGKSTNTQTAWFVKGAPISLFWWVPSFAYRTIIRPWDARVKT